MNKLIKEFNEGTRRKTDPRYKKLSRASPCPQPLATDKGKGGGVVKAHALGIQARLGRDLNYKRLWYVRYADDFLIGVIGSYDDCHKVRKKITDFLKESLKMELNLEKTKITHATTDRAKFLGLEIRITPYEKKPVRRVVRGDQSYMIKLNTSPQLLAPLSNILDKLREMGLIKKGNIATS
jgi:hypothetical protein